MPTSPAPPAVYLFDAYGTLLDVHSAVRRHAERLGPDAAAISAHWRQRQLEYSWIAGLSGTYRDFARLTEEALDHALATFRVADPALKADLLAAYSRLTAYPEVRPVLQALREAGCATAILSNGSPGMLADAVAAAGIEPLLDAVLSVDPLATYKPAPEVYRLAVDRFGLTDPTEAAFHSSNAWDVAGATAYGFRTRWIDRTKAVPEYRHLPPEAVWADLTPLLAEAGAREGADRTR